jgi:hypothetical protein
MSWAQIVEHSILWIGLVSVITTYVVKRKWYPLMYLISIALYIFTAVFIIDKFDVSKNWILLILVFSTVVMIWLGYYLSRK